MPGHFKAYTLWLSLLFFISSTIYLGGIQVPIGFVLVIVGLFIGDQATHLAQADHSAPPPTIIERWMQNNPNFAKLLGTITALLGGYLICDVLPPP